MNNGLFMFFMLFAVFLSGISQADEYSFDDYQHQEDQNHQEQQFQSELLQAIKHLNTEYQAQHYLSPDQYLEYQQRYSPQYAPQYLHQYDNRYR